MINYTQLIPLVLVLLIIYAKHYYTKLEAFRHNVKRGMVVKFKIAQSPMRLGRIISIRKDFVVISELGSLDYFTVRINNIYQYKD